MGLPRGKRELEAAFRAASVPEPAGLEGEYAVDMLTGLPSLKPFGHRKKFFAQEGRPAGHNLTFGGWVWGRFVLSPGECADLGGPALFIDYDRPGNSFVSRPMRDCVRRISEGFYLGRLYYQVRGRAVFLGFFALEKT